MFGRVDHRHLAGGIVLAEAGEGIVQETRRGLSGEE
jgi:hypothetical protein